MASPLSVTSAATQVTEPKPRPRSITKPPSHAPSALVLDLVSAGFDLAIRIGALDDSALVARKLATNRRVLCASPAYLRRRGVPQTPADLERHECLLLAGRQGKHDSWRLTDGKQGELLRDASVAGLGIAMHSMWHVCEDLSAGRLRVVLPNYPIADTGIYAVMPQRRLTPPRACVRRFPRRALRRRPVVGKDCSQSAGEASTARPGV